MRYGQLSLLLIGACLIAEAENKPIIDHLKKGFEKVASTFHRFGCKIKLSHHNCEADDNSQGPEMGNEFPYGHRFDGGSDHLSGGSHHYPGGSHHYPGGFDRHPDGSDHYSGGSDHYPGGFDRYPDGSDRYPGGNDHFPVGTNYLPDGSDRQTSTTVAPIETTTGKKKIETTTVEPQIDIRFNSDA